MFPARHTPLLLKILEKERDAFIAQAKNSTEVATDTAVIDKGNILFKISAKRESLAILTDGIHNHCIDVDKFPDNNEVSYYNSHEFLRTVTDKFINIPANASFIECINTIHTYQHHAGNHFYGALLRSVDDPDIILNPFHILTALSVLENDEYLNQLKFNILIYFYPDRSRLDGLYHTSKADLSLVEENINALMRIYTSKLPTITKVNKITTKYKDDFADCMVAIMYSEQIHKDEDSEKIYHIVSQQLLTEGIMAPYYGTSLIRWDRPNNGNCYGQLLSPMGSANISHNSYIHLKDPKHNKESFSVCTGKESNTTYTGLRTLTHSNLSSPYRHSSLAPGFMAYVDTMIEKSTQLYIAAGILVPFDQRPVPSITDRYTPEELAASSFNTFVKLHQPMTSTKLPLALLRERYRELQEYKTSLDTPDTEVCDIESPSESCTIASTTSDTLPLDGCSTVIDVPESMRHTYDSISRSLYMDTATSSDHTVDATSYMPTTTATTSVEPSF